MPEGGHPGGRDQAGGTAAERAHPAVGELVHAALGVDAGEDPRAQGGLRRDEEARALGVEAGKLRAIVIAAATLLTASVVAISGVIGWVGLVIPHIARMLVGPAFSRLLPMSLALGAGYLVLVDTLARSLARIETPIGILTAIVGAPFFIWLLWRGRDDAA